MEKIGFLGLGAMGAPMAVNLVERGYPVLGWDIRPEAREAFAARGGQAAESEEEVLGQDRLAVSMPHSDVLKQVAEEVILPRVKAGQVVMDFTTVIPGLVRELDRKFSEAGAHYLDCPVSGGPGGAEQRILKIFVGGTEEVFEQARPILEAASCPEEVFYCGPSGSGQVVKGVNQLGLGLVNAAVMEAIHYGVAAGVPAETISRAVGGDSGFRRMIRVFSERVPDGGVSGIPIKYDQYPFFLEEARERGIRMPLVSYLHEMLKDAPTPVLDANQWAPSYWDHLSGTNSKANS